MRFTYQHQMIELRCVVYLHLTWNTMMNGKILLLYVTLCVCLITSCSSLSITHPTQSQVQNTLHLRERSIGLGNGIPLPVTKTRSCMGIRISKRNQQSHVRTYNSEAVAETELFASERKGNILMDWELEEEMHIFLRLHPMPQWSNTINESIY